jgi:hypothetical protein
LERDRGNSVKENFFPFHIFYSLCHLGSIAIRFGCRLNGTLSRPILEELPVSENPAYNAPQNYMALSKVIETFRMMRQVARDLEQLRLAVGRVEARQVAGNLGSGDGRADKLSTKEFQVFSQWGEDGIIAHLVDKAGVSNKVFLEFGVENYREANTRFLLQHRQWSGLVIDGAVENIESIKRDPIFWKFNLKAEAAFVDRESINRIIEQNGLQGRIGLLSVDIDGNDYWVWEAISQVDPDIVVVEYNGLFGAKEKIVVPYAPRFMRGQAHYSHLYFGASLAALTELGAKKGYSLVGTNSNGCNGFFVRNSQMNGLKSLTAEEAYHPPSFREARDKSGNLSYLSASEGLQSIGSLPVIDLADKKEKSIGSLFS